MGLFLEAHVDNYNVYMHDDLLKLRLLIRELVEEKVRGGSQPEESYDELLMDDPAFEAPSVYVKDEWKAKIKKWAKDMKLA